ncbi:MAG: methyltransferase [Alphaproteobacteria bacterium RIFOXYD12_FULL_60_8]|nr:MAG: methyltransferase [Alphaproteobacteria bacterium RIFOXYD12_FULL_60_8]
MKHGDYTNLANNYASHRPGYAPVVRNILMSLPGKPISDMSVADVGAGTGIWTRMMADLMPKTILGVEPNDAMRGEGERGNNGRPINWCKGSGEKTGLADASLDLLTMASSFHWVDFDMAMAEFKRVLRPGGWFAALWNPRFLEDSPLLLEIEDELRKIVPDLKRVSSGHGEFTESLLGKLRSVPELDDVIYLEGFHTEVMSKERYLGAWRSVNDIQVQAGPDRFKQFLNYIEDRLTGADTVEAAYRTRAWAARYNSTR